MPTSKCYRCGKPGGQGEPPTCPECFIHFYRHDASCADSVYAAHYCGGDCPECGPVKAERQRLQGERRALKDRREIDRDWYTREWDAIRGAK